MEDTALEIGLQRLVGLRILIVDDERNIRSALRVCLEQAGCEVAEAATAEAALAALAQRPFDMAFVDLRLGLGSGLDLLPQLLAEDAGLDVVVVTAYATFDTAVEAVQRGARDYLPKPFTPAQIRTVVARLAERRTLRARLSELEGRLAETAPEASLETNSPRNAGRAWPGASRRPVRRGGAAARRERHRQERPRPGPPLPRARGPPGPSSR